MSHQVDRRAVLTGSAAVLAGGALAPLAATTAARAEPAPPPNSRQHRRRPAGPPATRETVAYDGFDGFDSVTYSSRFFGPDNAMNRDFTYYGTSFEQVHTTTIDLAVDAAAFSRGARMLLGPVFGRAFDDLVFHDPAHGSVDVLRGAGDGTFAAVSQRVRLGRRGGALVIGDLYGTGAADLGLYEPRTGTVHWYLGDRQGRFRPGPFSWVGRDADQILALDVTGDGHTDLVIFHAPSTVTTLRGDGHGRFHPVRRVHWPEPTAGGILVGADFDEDHWGDLAFYQSAAFPDGLSFRMGNGDGTFGPRPDEVGSMLANHAACRYAVPDPAPVLAAGQIDADGAADLALYDPRTRQLTTRIVFDGRPDYAYATQPAYDYSVDLIRDRGVYKMWSGGRWQTYDQDPYSQDVTTVGDGDHILYSWSRDGRRWFRQRGPIWFNGGETGHSGWWTANTLEPEVVIVDGHYYMYWQVEIDAGKQVDTGQIATYQADRIGVSTSDDGVHWTRKTDRSAVVGIDAPEQTMLDHEEVIYVPDDPDGKPYWMYVFHFIAGAAQGHVRLRTADPTTYQWADREPVSGLSQIGNQIGYADDAPGGRVFVRITFTADDTGRTVPTIQLSRDGLTWATASGAPLLAGSTDNGWNPNCYFLGLSTLEHGRLERTGPHSYRAIYGATTAQAPGGLPIFYSEIGTGELTLTFNR